VDRTNTLGNGILVPLLWNATTMPYHKYDQLDTKGLFRIVFFSIQRDEKGLHKKQLVMLFKKEYFADAPF